MATATSTTRKPRNGAPPPQLEPPVEEEPEIEEEITPEEQAAAAAEPSRTLQLQKVQSRIVGLLERTLGDDEEGKRRVIRSTEALLGIEI